MWGRGGVQPLRIEDVAESIAPPSPLPTLPDGGVVKHTVRVGGGRAGGGGGGGAGGHSYVFRTADTVANTDRIQGTAEDAPFSEEAFGALFGLAKKGVAELAVYQRRALGLEAEAAE